MYLLNTGARSTRPPKHSVVARHVMATDDNGGQPLLVGSALGLRSNLALTTRETV